MDRNNPRFNDFDLLDDGTMDTVIQCKHCGEVMRFNPEMPDPEECPDWDRIDDALEMADSDHECPPDEARLPDLRY